MENASLAQIPRMQYNALIRDNIPPGDNGVGTTAMKHDKSDLILHPVRWRILRAARSGAVTAQRLAAALPDVPQASLYRHLNTLADSGLLQVVEERKVRGTVERVYSLGNGADDLSGETVGLNPEGHMRLFGAFLSNLIADYSRYLDRGNVDLYRDGVGFRQREVYLSDEEFARMAAELRDLLARYSDCPPGKGRTPRLVTTIVMPAVDPADLRPDGTQHTED
jgi:DNA-binding transcriptional ArsR family regulator